MSNSWSDQAHWLEDYALFRALKDKVRRRVLPRMAGGVGRSASRRRSTAPGGNLPDQIGQACFAQFLLFRQGERLKAHAHGNGVQLDRRPALFRFSRLERRVGHPELFLLDEQRRPRFVAGVPPDYFSAQGQLWGNPVYNWDALRRVRLSLVHRPLAVLFWPTST